MAKAYPGAKAIAGGSYLPYGGNAAYNPYGGYAAYNPYGGYAAYNPYGGYAFSTYPFKNYPSGYSSYSYSYSSSGSCDCAVAIAPAPHVADLKDVFKWVPRWVWQMRDSVMNIWDFWGIQMLVICSISFQLILTLFGGRRKYVSGLTGLMMRFVVACMYLFATEVVPFSLGKLTGLRITDPNHPNPFVELKALLAPLLLLQLGYSDNITAYATQDTQLGGRQVLNLTIVVLVVCSILIRCWTYSNFVILFIPMFLAGIIKYGEGVWALKFAIGWNTGITGEDITERRVVPKFLRNLPNVKGLDLLLKAFYRFDCLKPHLENWIYLPSFISQPELSIDQCLPKESFRVAEIELGFMYDALYTKSLVIYSKAGLLVRFFSFFWLLVTLFGFISASRNLPQVPGSSAYRSFTLSILVSAVLLELYQIMSLPFSDWAIVKMAKHRNCPLVESLLSILAPRSFLRWRKWSNSSDQFNILAFCLRDDWTKYANFLKCGGINEYIKRSWSHYKMGPVKVPPDLKEMVIVELRYFDEVRKSHPFTRRGEWTLERFGARELKGSIKKGFDKSIVVWHLATDMCYYSNDVGDSSNSRSFSKLLSDYMAYLLALHPNMLSTTTGNIVLGHTLKEIKKFLEDQTRVKTKEELALAILGRAHPTITRSTSKKSTEALIISEWKVLAEARELASSLMRRRDRWALIFSMWMEMLCYAGYNCPVTYHTEQLRRGGELITIVWLLLAHNTNKLTLDD